MKKILLILCLLGVSSNLALADTVYLKDDSAIKGTVQQINQDSIAIMTDYGQVHINKDKILNIIYNNETDRPSKQKFKSDDLLEPELLYLGIYLGAGTGIIPNELNASIRDYSLNNQTQPKTKAAVYLNFGLSFSVGTEFLLSTGYSSFGFYWKEANSTVKSNYDLSASGFYLELKYYWKEIHDGFFFSIAPGVSNIVLTKTEEGQSDKKNTSNLGFSLRGGPGYAINVNRFNSAFNIGLEGFYTYAKFEDTLSSTTKTWSFSGFYAYFGWIW